MADTLSVVFIVIQAVLVAIFTYQSRRQQRNARLIILALSFGILASVLSLGTEVVPLERRALLSLQLMTYGVEYILLYVHFNISVSDVLDPLKFSVLASLFGVLAVFSVKYMLYSLEDFDEFIWDMSYNFLGLLAFGYVTLRLWRSYRFSGEREALIQAIGTAMLTLGFVLGALSTPYIKAALAWDIRTDTGDVIKAVGALIFITIFAINVDFVERLSVETYGMLLFDQSGKALGFYNLRTKRYSREPAIGIDPNLFAPLVSALTVFVKEALGAKSYMRSIVVEDKIVIFEMGEKVHTALIAERSTLLLNMSMRNFRRSCEVIAEMEPREFRLGNIDHDAVKNQLRRHFPYVEVTGQTT